MIRTRIAPSPTGLFHIGTARAALFNYLFAKRYGGTFVLRIEDTDLERSDKKFEQDIFDGLTWLGITPDEGPLEGGSFGPYRQSERIETYKPYIEKLLNEGKAFYCFHSEEELAAEQDRLFAERKQPLHRCEYRNLSLEEAEKKRKSGKASIIRFKIPTEPSNHQTIFDDLIRGQVHIYTRLLGDFSIAKSLDIPLYNFAVVIDDYEMHITHVIRGEDHISNTPKQLLIANALGLAPEKDGIYDPPWKYAHLPLILGTDRSKLSKRHGAISVSEYRNEGYLPEAMINFMAFLGWNPGDERELFSLDTLENEFSLENVQKAGAVFNQEKLDWFNAQYIKQKSVEELSVLCAPYLTTAGFRSPSNTFVNDVIALEQQRLKKLSDIAEHARFFFELPEYDAALLAWKDSSLEKTVYALECARGLLECMTDPFDEVKLQEVFFDEIGKNFGGKGELLWPLRTALSGQKQSPGPFEIMKVLGKEESLRRVDTALAKLK